MIPICHWHLRKFRSNPLSSFICWSYMILYHILYLYIFITFRNRNRALIPSQVLLDHGSSQLHDLQGELQQLRSRLSGAPRRDALRAAGAPPTPAETWRWGRRLGDVPGIVLENKGKHGKTYWKPWISDVFHFRHGKRPGSPGVDFRELGGWSTDISLTIDDNS